MICREIARDPRAVSVLSGMILMSGVLDSQFETTPFYTAHLPLFFAHGTDDTVYKWQDQDGLYRNCTIRAIRRVLCCSTPDRTASHCVCSTGAIR